MEQSKTTHTSTTSTNENVPSEMKNRRSQSPEQDKSNYIKDIKISRMKNFMQESTEIGKLRDQPIRFAKKLLHKNSRIKNKALTVSDKAVFLRPR